MKVRVNKSTADTYWYAKHIGEVFEVQDSGRDYELLPYDPNGGFYIEYEDCEIVDGTSLPD